MKKIIAAIIIALSFSLAGKAQETNGYKDALGIRLGSSVPVIQNGVTYKHFMNKNAIEGILSFGDGVGLCGLYEIHKPLSTQNLQWLIGFGGYVGFNNSTTNVGGAGIIGLDYKFDKVPLNLTLDWKPELNLVSKIGFEASGIGFSARFTFK
ncbi:MAG: hypothetical protein JST86_20220 [Bacteroidetes bacterium]|nr:hypothetical protein [Bacteroidota bacterium]